MIILFVVVAIAIVACIAVLVVRDRPLLVDDPVADRPLRWDARAGVEDADLAEVRFTVALRGYQMSQVDRVLSDTREALIDRDEQIAELRQEVAALGQATTAPAADGREAPVGSALGATELGDGS